jgi:phenol 2-monooxygenase
MNVSMQDSYNLGWKIALVVKGIAKPDILKTYQSERRRVAQDLIEFDHRFSRLFSGRPAKDVMDEEGVSMEEFKDAFEKGNMFASGLSVNYGPSNIVAKAGDPLAQADGTKIVSPPGVSLTEETFAKNQALATGIPVGMRFNSFKVLNQACARPYHFQERLKADGRFRIVLFAGDVLDPEQKGRVETFCNRLDEHNSFLHRVTPKGQKVDSVIAVLTIHSSKRWDTDIIRDFPSILRPWDEQTGYDYEKVHVDDESYHEGYGNAYENYGVDRKRGCVVAVRPDQYVGWVGDLDDFDDLSDYFKGCLLMRDDAIVETNGNGRSKVMRSGKL